MTMRYERANDSTRRVDHPAARSAAEPQQYQDKPMRVKVVLTINGKDVRTVNQIATHVTEQDVTGMPFYQALQYLALGIRVTRKGCAWWVVDMPAVVIPEVQVNARTKVYVPNGDLRVEAYYARWTERGTWQIGWHPSRADMEAKDWEVVRDDWDVKALPTS